MTDEGFVDPGTPGDLSSGMRAKDLVNKPLLIRPNAVETFDGKDNEGNPKAYQAVVCDVWVLDRAGIIEQGTNVQFSWVRVMPQLTDRLGKFVAATPRRQEDNSIVLQAFSDDGREIARKAIAEIGSAAAAEEFVDGGETF